MQYPKLYLFLILILLFGCDKQPIKTEKKIEFLPMLSILKGSETGLKFKNIIPENERMNSLSYEYYYNGGGVSVGDVNKDGLPDIYLTGNVTPNKLYLNQGDFKFKDITNVSGLKDTPSWTTGTTMVDINNDGILDIYICRSGKLDEPQRRNQFFVSKGLVDGHPVYINQASTFGLDDAGYSTQAAFFDYDRDGDLDMYLLNHNVDVKPFYEVTELKKRRDPFVGDKLYRNDGGKFQDVSEYAGILGHEIGYGLGVSIGDLNNDGWPDIYVANDYSEHDYLYYNNHDGSFTERSDQALQHMSNFSMGTDIADFNNDGMMDIISLDMVAEDNYGVKTSMSGMNPERFEIHLHNGLQHQYMYNALQLNRGNDFFSEVGQMTGVHSTDWSWAPLFLDIDLDGYKDLFVTNGLKRDFRNNDYRQYKIKRLEAAEGDSSVNKSALIKELVALTPQKKIVNYIFQNQGGLSFEKKQNEWGINVPSYSNGLAYADFDNDGDLDLITNNIDEEPFIYRNNARQVNNNHYLKIRFVGDDQNIDGIGVTVKLEYEGKVQIQEHYLTRGYQSSVDKGMLFGLGETKKIEALNVQWPDGKIQNLSNISTNQLLSLDYKNAQVYDASNLSDREIVDVFHEKGMNLHHQETEYNDYKKESLLPHKMSQLGPGIAVSDVNQDGLDDFYIGGAKGYSGQLFIQNSEGEFLKSKISPWSAHQESEDMGALFFDANSDGLPDLYVVSGSNEDEKGGESLKDRLYINQDGNFIDGSHLLPDIYSSGFTIEAYDYDEDGDLDLFVGGRQDPGNYPYPVDSYLLENQKGQFIDVTTQIAPELSSIGMVTDALWSDYNTDGKIDLILVGEWMPMTVFTNRNGQFEKEIIAGTENSTGWWNCLISDDFDNDGDPDYVLGNNGLNYKYKATVQEPFDIFALDFDANGANDIVLGYYNEGKQFPLRGRECSSNQMPFIKEKFPTYHAFGNASLSQVYEKEKLDQALQYHVKTFASVYVENKGDDGFVFSELPRMAQVSAINQIIVADVNKDGNSDLIIAGNRYQSEVETPRNDASCGLVLLGDGKTSFKSIPSVESNLYLKGDVKDITEIRLAGGQHGLLVAKNNDKLQLLRMPNH